MASIARDPLGQEVDVKQTVNDKLRAENERLRAALDATNVSREVLRLEAVRLRDALSAATAEHRLDVQRLAAERLAVEAEHRGRMELITRERDDAMDRETRTQTIAECVASSLTMAAAMLAPDKAADAEEGA